MYISPRFLLLIISASLLLLVFNNQAEAGLNQQLKLLTEEIDRTGDDSIGTEYYTIADPEEEESKESDGQKFITPLNVLKTLNTLNNIELKENDRLDREQNLLKWVFHKSSHPDIPEKYQRKFHFGSWIRDPSRKSCLNIRGLVLQRDALGELTYADEKHCRIVASRWIDPYTQTELYDAEDIQIDHMVPLKNAYISGAWNWNAAQRCNYANFIGNNFHLLAVLGTENSRKSDRTPEEYIPPNEKTVCQYLVNWLKIKSIWRLKLAKQEALAIEQELKTYSCNTNDFQLEWNELQSQRSKSYENPEACDRR
jgi:hypothetical protein